MNFSNPKPLKINNKKQSAFSSVVEKIGAVIGLVELGGGMAMADKTKMLTPEQRNKAVRIIIFLLIWFVGLGIVETFSLMIQLIKYIF